MITAPDDALLGDVSDLVAERMGLNFPKERWPDLARGLKAAGKELGFEYPEACARWLESLEPTTGQIETLASYLTVGETYFLREPASFEALEREILPPLIAKRSGAGRQLRLWSAGCSTGEEPYSIAIACVRALPDPRGWNVSILATDINPKFLDKAEAGVYSEWSFRGAPDWLREGFFSPAPGDKLSIQPAAKNLVRFGYLNLAEDAYPSLHNDTNAMDVIFCRNVLMYFTPDRQRRVIEALHRCLVDGGYLLVNPAEASAFLFPMFAMEEIGGIIAYRKTSSPIRVESWTGFAAPAPAAPAPAAPAPAAMVETKPTILPVSPIAPIAPITASPLEEALALARTRADQGRLEEALSSCRIAIAAERGDPAARFLYAAICHELGRTEEAMAAMNKVLYLDQDFILAHHFLGGIYKRLGNAKESKRHFAVALGILSSKGKDEIVPESGGMTCGRLMESIQAMTGA